MLGGAVNPGDRVVDVIGEAFVVVEMPAPDGCVSVIPLTPDATYWAERRGWHKTSFYFRSRTLEASLLTVVETARYAR